ncbi:hypothetical protein OSB04_025646 [Centaurea solstitialis]|uniref:Uncharacterized protein n=1 Tax=Centaurea solstitialis TaxID=347529 RepID=A0AA38SNG7_9ASTR|nr:hypothetical protein OSB04_025646 [Centaurea solstitialis]
MDGAKEVATPLNSSVVLTPLDGSPTVDTTPYRKPVGSLQYLAFTRPDVSFAVNRLFEFMHSSTLTHWQALKRVLRYLKGTIHHGLFLKKRSSLDLTAFSDSDWGGVSNGGRTLVGHTGSNRVTVSVLGVNGGGVSRNRKPHHSNVVTAIDRYSNHRSAVVAIATAVDGGGGLVVFAGKPTAVVAVAAAVVDDFV